MDAVSYSHADKQKQRIEKVMANPDSVSGIVTVPKVIEASENITIPAGRVAVLPNVQVDGTLNVEAGGEIFIPAGANFRDLEAQIATKVNKDMSGYDSKTTPVDNDLLAVSDSAEGFSLKKLSWANTKATLNKALLGIDSITGTATFTNSSNNLNLTGIGNIGIEIGDVVEISGSVSNNGLYTAEILTDANNIVFNYEHRGQTVVNASKAFTNETSTANVTVKIYCKAKYADDSLGRDWCIPTSARTVGISYPNSIPRKMKVSVFGRSVDSGYGYILVGSRLIYGFPQVSLGVNVPMIIDIPSNKNYTITNVTLAASVMELR